VSDFGRDARASLAATLADRDPASATLCEGWDTVRLTAHLVLRDRNPLLAAAGGVPGLAKLTARAMDRLVDRPYQDLVDQFAAGPPRWSPMRHSSRLDTAANALEFFIHHEDLRRAASDAAPRALDPAFDDFIWRRLRRMAKLLMRKAPGGVTLRRAGNGGSIVVKRGSPLVVVTGAAPELALFAFGRQGAAVVETSGADDAIAALRGARLGF
jgi:uncharacterized protein (TIGR03085 family)